MPPEMGVNDCQEDLGVGGARLQRERVPQTPLRLAVIPVVPERDCAQHRVRLGMLGLNRERPLSGLFGFRKCLVRRDLGDRGHSLERRAKASPRVRELRVEIHGLLEQLGRPF